ncbi:twin-arginine translocase subunit TatC [Sporosarcina limicola]|uniref:Sec-independent protein translocase protein TatC n=1 Tax=Sporosarcina limicola TaxID=34101 RepID=A0A927MLQ7_9BACL|nr:twin-arginine translocase subunit TatC [Sporosarcina limicola]MBE1556273.1 sec-independent protein translocase protein TatC [Sporosarcina limicola]
MDPYGDHNREILSPLDKPSAIINEDTVGIEIEESVSVISSEGNGSGLESDPTLVGHLTDLRKQLVKSATVFLFFLITVFLSINLWFPYITRGHELIILGPLEVVKFYMSISTAIAFGLSIPFLCHFLWQFVKPGLNERESRFLSLYSPVMLLLFLIGVSFGYYIVNPLSYKFLVSLGAVNFNVMVSAQEYISFLLMTTLPIGILFELPIVALFLAAIGLLTTESMRRVRKWSYLAIAVISALITPPDFVSQLIVLIPMALLYEASIYIVRHSERRSAVTN